MSNQFKRTEFPCYKLPAGATPDQIRAMAVQAMFDGLTVPWTPKADFSYGKVANGKPTEFLKTAGTEYVGLPYTDGRGGVLTWLQYYDFETGTFDPPADRNFNANLGNSCASAVANGWRAVIPDFYACATYSFTRSRGCTLVGDYEMDLPETGDLRHVGTKETIEKNGREKIMECYTLVKPGDLLLYICYESNKGNHAIMAADTPSVVRFPDGRIDPQKSVLVIQDQRFYQKPHEVNGEMMLISGRVRTGVTFAQMISEGYIPITHPVLTGEVPYTPAALSVEGAPSLTGWKDLTLVSNYQIVALKAVFTDGAGKVLGSEKRVSYAEEFVNGIGFRFPLEKMAVPAVPAGAKRLTLSAMVTTGEVLTAFAVDL
ncbi:MAG: hypothetical protein J6Z79_06400 [Clostridia bacterium]|nr:hypothetical protein [Clostridia bacterium]